MEYIQKNDDAEKVYSVFYDSEGLEKLLDEIVRNASYKTNGCFTMPRNSVLFEGNVFTSGAVLPNGDPEYENIEEIDYCTSDGPYSYYNDSIRVNGTKITSPKLAFIIKKILSDDSDGIYEFFDYKDSSELLPIDEQIKKTNVVVNGISNFDFDNKIYALNNLKSLCEDKKEKRYFDVELLKQYYSQASALIGLELVSEKIVKKCDKILLRDYETLK